MSARDSFQEVGVEGFVPPVGGFVASEVCFTHLQNGTC